MMIDLKESMPIAVLGGWDGFKAEEEGVSWSSLLLLDRH